MNKQKIEIKPEVREYFRELGKRRGLELKNKYGSEYFKKISSMRKRFGRIKEKDSVSDLAKEFKVSRQRIYQILNELYDKVEEKEFKTVAEYRRFLLKIYFEK